MKDKFNENMSYITHLFVLYAILRGSEVLSTFSRNQMMYNVPCDVPCAEVTSKDYSYKVKNKIKH